VKLVPEGVSGLLPYRGAVSEVTEQLVGGLRSGMGYVGAADLEDLRTKASFVRQSAAGARESHVHDLEVVHEAPNYQVPGSR
jgi:IMP dehydrogenase